MRYELVVLGPGRDVDTDHLESDAPLDLSQPIKLTDGTLVHAIARVDRPGITGIVCHPQTGIRVVFDVDGNLHPLAHDHAVDVAEDLVGYSTHPARDEHEATADRTAAATIERALAETPHCPPVRLSSPQLAQGQRDPRPLGTRRPRPPRRTGRAPRRDPRRRPLARPSRHELERDEALAATFRLALDDAARRESFRQSLLAAPDGPPRMEDSRRAGPPGEGRFA